MAGHTPISPAEIERAAEVFRETGNYAEAARAIGRDATATRRALVAAAEPLRASLHTQALARAEREARLALVAARQKLELSLATATDAKEVAAITAQIHDNARATTQMRVAHAKMMGTHAPEKHEHSGDALALFAGRIARLADSDEEGEGASGPH